MKICCSREMPVSFFWPVSKRLDTALAKKQKRIGPHLSTLKHECSMDCVTTPPVSTWLPKLLSNPMSASPFIAQHPLLAHKMTILRDKNTSATDFRKVIKKYNAWCKLRTIVQIFLYVSISQCSGRFAAKASILMPCLYFML